VRGNKEMAVGSSVASDENLGRFVYSPLGDMDYGTITCRAANHVGRQIKPCSFAITQASEELTSGAFLLICFAAGRPHPPSKCVASNVTKSVSTLRVQCVAEYGGGLTQTFFLEVYDAQSGHLRRNASSDRPIWSIRVPRGRLLRLEIYATNFRGPSRRVRVENVVAGKYGGKGGPERRTDDSGTSFDEMNSEDESSTDSLLFTIMGMVLFLVVLLLATALFMHRRQVSSVSFHRH